MRKIILIGLIILTVKVSAQTICESQAVMPNTTFNQCDNNPWTLVFEDNFEGNSLDLSKWSYGPRIRYCNDEFKNKKSIQRSKDQNKCKKSQTRYVYFTNYFW